MARFHGARGVRRRGRGYSRICCAFAITQRPFVAPVQVTDRAIGTKLTSPIFERDRQWQHQCRENARSSVRGERLGAEWKGRGAVRGLRQTARPRMLKRPEAGQAARAAKQAKKKASRAGKVQSAPGRRPLPKTAVATKAPAKKVKKPPPRRAAPPKSARCGGERRPTRSRPQR